MPASAYCENADIFALVPPEAFVHPRQKVETVSVSLSTLTVRAHGLPLDHPVTVAPYVTVTGQSGVLPAPLAAGTVYYAIPAGSDGVKLAASPGGAAIALTDVGSGVFGILRDYEPDLTACRYEAARLIDWDAIAHRSPLSADQLKGCNARLGTKLYAAAHPRNPPFAERFEASNKVYAEEYEPRLARLAAGASLPAGSSDATPTIAENGSVIVPLQGRGYLIDCEPDRA